MILGAGFVVFCSDAVGKQSLAGLHEKDGRVGTSHDFLRHGSKVRVIDESCETIYN